MTGFGRGVASCVAGQVVVLLRCVNHRFLDVRIRAALELHDYEAHLDRAARDRFRRGRVEIVARLLRGARGRVRFDHDLARAYLAALEGARKELGIAQEVSLDLLANIPEVFQLAPEADAEELERAVVAAAGGAAEAAEVMRTAEGEALARDLAARIDRLEGVVDRVETLVPDGVSECLDRLRARVDRLLEGRGTTVDDQRLAQEIAMLADRSDISEELTRLRSHCAQFRRIAGEQELVGQRLDFLLQEMSREASTLGAKAGDMQIQHASVELRAELARMREQVQNVE